MGRARDTKGQRKGTMTWSKHLTHLKVDGSDPYRAHVVVVHHLVKFLRLHAIPVRTTRDPASSSGNASVSRTSLGNAVPAFARRLDPSRGADTRLRCRR